MRIGGTIFEEYSPPFEWAQAVRGQGYSAAFCPVADAADEDTVREWRAEAERANIVIAEVGAWGNNPISPDKLTRKAGIQGCCRKLELADRIGANCCVNVAGSLGERWAGPSDGNLSDETFALIVDSVRESIDSVKPTRTVYALETMPWLIPHSPQVYAKLLRAVQRDRFAVHLDPVNLINCPERYYDTRALLEECFNLLGPHVVSCHAKDIILRDDLTMHLSECPPGLGNLDWGVFVRELGRLDRDIPLMIEHLSDPEDSRAAAAYIRNVAQIEGVPVV